jgi:hypothetical protein
VDTGSAPHATGVSAREAEVLSGVAGGPERARGEDELAAMGAAPMAPV